MGCGETRYLGIIERQTDCHPPLDGCSASYPVSDERALTLSSSQYSHYAYTTVASRTVKDALV